MVAVSKEVLRHTSLELDQPRMVQQQIPREASHPHNIKDDSGDDRQYSGGE